jgi:hypothetical protein
MPVNTTAEMQDQIDCLIDRLLTIEEILKVNGIQLPPEAHKFYTTAAYVAGPKQ